MINVTEVSVSYGVTKNIGNFESLRLEVTEKVTIEHEDPSGIIESLYHGLCDQVNQLVSEEKTNAGGSKKRSR